jgi:hypothetical protein
MGTARAHQEAAEIANRAAIESALHANLRRVVGPCVGLPLPVLGRLPIFF